MRAEALLAVALHVSPRWLLIGCGLVAPWLWVVVMDRVIRRPR